MYLCNLEALTFSINYYKFTSSCLTNLNKRRKFKTFLPFEMFELQLNKTSKLQNLIWSVMSVMKNLHNNFIWQDLFCVRSDLGNLLKALGRLEEAKVIFHWLDTGIVWILPNYDIMFCEQNPLKSLVHFGNILFTHRTCFSKKPAKVGLPNSMLISHKV